MEDQNDQMMAVLQFNKGFTDPEKWINYGITHRFKKTRADKIQECPDCSTRSFKHIGQFVYYSTLVNLQCCAQCGLVFTDTRIDPKVISTHFEEAYKEEEYFLRQRVRIFEQISRIADRIAPQGGRILDVGGAKGHLLAVLKKVRPDLNFMLNDLSKVACDHAESRYGFQTILGGISELEKVSSRFDVIILSDVIYYEPELRKLWTVLPGLVSENGAIVIRVPNKLALVRFRQFIGGAISGTADNEMQDNIQFFNPEHLYIFSRRYLLMRLKSIGFNQVSIIPSELLINHQGDWVGHLIYYFCKMLSIISFGKLIITPSLLVIARNEVSKVKA